MKGTVINIDYQKGFVYVDTGCSYTTVELLGGYEINIGDVITGNLHSLGREKLKNISTGEVLDVFIQDI